MERTKRKYVESVHVVKAICSYSKSKKLKLDQSSKEKTEFIIVKVEPLAFLKHEEDEDEWSKSPNEDFPNVEELNKCPKCSISYKSKASMKNHIQVCKSEDQNQVIFRIKNLLFEKIQNFTQLSFVICIMAGVTGLFCSRAKFEHYFYSGPQE